MRIRFFYHSLVSDWNHGNAHFLRGVASELIARGHDLRIYEPEDAWSVWNLTADYGTAPLDDFRQAYPELTSTRYRLAELNLDYALDSADLVIVHEWNDRELVSRIGQHHAREPNYKLLFHDTHHRAVTSREEIAAYDLTHYDGVLAFGRVIRDLYLREGWTPRAWTWHEAADTRVFYPRMKDEGGRMNEAQNGEHDSASDLHPASFILHPSEADLVWIGNWGDDERTTELREFLIEPVKRLKLRARVYGVRYPEEARRMLDDANIEYSGWLPNYRAPEVFAGFKMTVHVPRRPYTKALPGVPTIRPFEALACGIPLVSAPWSDAENLFTPGADFLVARDGEEMTAYLDRLRSDAHLRRTLAAHGLATIRARHTCAHRVDELMKIYDELTTGSPAASERARTA